MKRFHVTDEEITLHRLQREEHNRLIQTILNDIRSLARKGFLGEMSSEELNDLLNEEEKDLRLLTYAELRETLEENHVA